MTTSKKDPHIKLEEPVGVVLFSRTEANDEQDALSSKEKKPIKMILEEVGPFPHCQLVEAPNIAPKERNKSNPSYRCPECNQEYSQPRLTSHTCEPHLKNFRPFKK